jgi:hypothetical protein
MTGTKKLPLLPAIPSDKDQIIFRKAKIGIDYENPNNAWKEHAKKGLMHD